MKRKSAWALPFARQAARLTRLTMRAGARTVDQALLEPARKRSVPPAGTGDWLHGLAMGPTGARHYRLFRPSGARWGERLPMLVMLHGCHQDARTFAASTRMNVLAARERFLVLYPEQDRMSNAQGCWNWFDTRSGRAHGEAASIMSAIDQAQWLYGADGGRVAVAGLSAGASMAALLASRHPERFQAVVMHSGIPPGTADSTGSAIAAMYGRRSTKPMAASRPDAAWPPLLVIHGERDSVVDIGNGIAAANVWAEAAGATGGTARTVQRGKRHAMTVTDFKSRGRLAVTLVRIDALGHAWSGGAASEKYGDANGPDASRLTWAFVNKQFARVA